MAHPTTLPGAAAERHRVVADTFAERVSATRDWDAPAPVAGWTALDVVDHLVTWLPGFLSGGGVTLPPGTKTADDPVSAWRDHCAAVQELLATRGEEPFTHPQIGTFTLAEAVDRFYTADVFLHTWDLSRATGHEPDLDEGYAEELLTGMRPIEEMLRASGQYGAPVAVAEDATVVDQLMGFIGRDPAPFRHE